MENRKWFTQMSEEERQRIQKAVHTHSNWQWSVHAKGRLTEKCITEADVLQVLRFGKLFEIHQPENKKDVLALFRHCKNGYSVAVVVSLISGLICTVYKNNMYHGIRKPEMAAYKWRCDFSEISTISTKNLELLGLIA